MVEQHGNGRRPTQPLHRQHAGDQGLATKKGMDGLRKGSRTIILWSNGANLTLLSAAVGVVRPVRAAVVGQSEQNLIRI